jgi:phenylacetate-CoA ligase
MGRKYRKTINFLQESIHWTTEQWHVYQTERLRDLMVYCSANVPYYKRIFEVKNIDVDAKDIWAEFLKVPPIDKAFVMDNFSEFLPIHLPNIRGYSATTGGTTGKPMQTFYEPQSFSREWAYKIFFWNLAIGYTPSSRKATFRGVSFNDGLYVENPIYNEIRFSPFHLDTAGVADIVQKLVDYSPEYVHGYPSALYALAKYLLDNGIQLRGVRGAMMISENIYSHQRAIISQAFDCPTYSFYGHSERLIFASMGPELDVYYAHPAYGITELLDDAGGSIDGLSQIGELVGTGFINKGMPLLRFKTGDYSSWTKSEGAIQMPSLSEIKGRWAQEYVIGKEGKKVSLTSLNMHSDVYAKVKKMQYVQNEPGKIKINIVKEDGYSKSDESYIYSEHVGKLGEQFSVEFAYVESLEKTQAGKTKFLLQGVDLD